MKSLYECIEPEFSDLKVLRESNGDHKGDSLCMVGTFIQAEVRNRNNRIYPLHEITKAVDAIKSKINSGYSVLGELDHPAELHINLDRVSHVITDMWMEGNRGCGKLKIIDKTPLGKIAKGLLESGVKLGVSSRGSGDVMPDGRVVGYKIVTVDIVAQPSAPDAYPKSIYESLYNMYGGEILCDSAAGAIEGDKIATKHFKKHILQFIDELEL